MLDITTITRQSLGKVVSYYADGADDYYAKDGSSMQWQGGGADALGLTGQVEQARFKELLDGRISQDVKLKRGNGEANKERLGYDMTFSAPKGVSLQALVHGDQRIIDAHDRAVAAAVREAETLAMARKTENKKTSIERTDNLVVAKFRHETSRELDPDLHTHAFVLNMTQRADGEWRALTNDGIINSQSFLGNIYKAELAKELTNAGFQLRYEANGTFDLAHFTDVQIREFSARSQQIEQALAAKGLDRSTATYEEKSKAALSTRKKKQAGVNHDEVRKEWRNRARDLGIDFDSREWAGAGSDSASPDASRRSTPTPQIEKPLEWHADRILDFAIKSLTERQAIVREGTLTDKALKHGFGRLSIDDVRNAIERKTASGHLIKEEALYVSATELQKHKEATRKNNGKSAEKPLPTLTRSEWIKHLVAGGRQKDDAIKLVDKGIASGRLEKVEQQFTTHIAMQREKDILRMERAGRGMVEQRVTPEAARAFIDTRSLNAEQGKAVERIATSTNQFSAVQGHAGVGKSYMTNAAKELLEANAVKVVALAPYAAQVKALQSEGLEARTVQSFLKAADKKIDANTVVFIDESGVLPARQMKELMSVIQGSRARAVFLGDTSQTKAIEAGKPFDQLQKAGIETSHLKDIQRQKVPELLQAVKLAAEGNSAKSVAHVKSISEFKDAGERHAALVAAYVGMPANEREKTLVITGTNESRKEINDGIRKGLGLEGSGHKHDLFNRVDTTQAERQHSKYYPKEAIIVPEIDYANGLKRGASYKVLDNGPGNRLTVRSAEGEVIQFSPARCTKLSVYKIEKTELSVGDQVRITRNNKDFDLATNDRFVVTGSSPGLLTLEGGGRTVELTGKAAQFVSLAYCSTVHSAQGATCDKVLLNVDTKSRTTTKEVWYVGISRARYDADVFTNDVSRLAKAVSRINGKSAALEIKQLQRFGLDRGPLKVKQKSDHRIDHHRPSKERNRGIDRSSPQIA
ncbi:TPA: MobF family relaxase [Pseudomonas putida]